MSMEPFIKTSASATPATFEEVEHTADRAVRIYGSDLKTLFINAVHGMNSILVNDVSTVPMQVEKQIELEAIDAESLLVEWLSEFAYWAETKMLVFHKFDLHTATRTQIQATAGGGKALNLEKHIKAVTYHDLEIIEDPNGLSATVVFDV